MLFWTGTANVENGSTSIAVASGPALTAEVARQHSMVALDGVIYFVDSLTSTIALEVTRDYSGPDGAVPMEIWPVSHDTANLVNLAQIVSRTQAQINVLDKNSQGLFYSMLGVTGAADPGPGMIAFNNADPASATQAYVDVLDANGRDVAGLLGLWQVGTTLVFRSLTTTAYRAYNVNAFTGFTGHRQIGLTYIDHDGVIADGEHMAVSWSRVGEGLRIDQVGTFAQRATYNGQDAGFVYLSVNGNGSSNTTPSLYRKASLTNADWSAQVPFQGPQGDRGWSPIFGLVADGARRVMRLTDYIGGAGAKPATGIGQYVSTGGLTANIAAATDVRGAQGLSAFEVAQAAGFGGTLGQWLASLVGDSAYEIAVANGFSGSQSAWLASLIGVDGTDPGILYIFDEGTADANPGSGLLRADSADLTAATYLFVSKTNKAGNDVAGFLNGITLSDSVRKGTLILTRSGGNAQVAFDVMGAVDAVGYVKVQVANGAGATGLLQNDAISFQFTTAGDRGTNGDGAGDFIGPEIAVQDNLVAFDGTSGKAGKDSGAKLSDLVKVDLNGADFSNKRATLDNLTLKGADIASAATLNLDTATGHFVNVTGTTATSAITLASGKQRLVRAAGAWPITVSTNLVLSNGGGNYVCAAGDMILFVADGVAVRGLIFPNSGRALRAPPDFTGDSGTGGVSGLVPAPGAGDAALGKVLAADGTWKAVSGQTTPRVFTKPEGFDWPGVAGGQVNTRALMATRQTNGRFDLLFDFWAPPHIIGINTRKRYYVATNGLPDAAGTESAPLSIAAALAKTDAYEIVLSPGTYFNQWDGTTPAGSQINITVANGGKADFIVGENFAGSWTVTSTAGVYQTIGAAGAYESVINLMARGYFGEFGEFLTLPEVADLTALTAGAVGWTKNGTTSRLYVRFPGNIAPPSLVVLRNTYTPRITGGSRYYIKGCDFYGGAHGFNVTTSTACVLFENCRFHGSRGNGLDVDDALQGVFLKNCVATRNYLDGFNYHDSGPANPSFYIELDCIAVGNGWGNPSATNCNGSTAHDNARGIRFNGMYGKGRGPSLHDVGPSQSWNVGCLAFGSEHGSGASFQCGGSISYGTKMWLDSCVSYGSTVDAFVDGAGSELFLRDFTSEGVITAGAGASVDAY